MGKKSLELKTDKWNANIIHEVMRTERCAKGAQKQQNRAIEPHANLRSYLSPCMGRPDIDNQPMPPLGLHKQPRALHSKRIR